MTTNKFILLVVLLLLPPASYPIDVPSEIVSLAHDELKDYGIKGNVYKINWICFGLHDIQISVPKKFKGIDFNGADITLEDNGKEFAFFTLQVVDVDETIYQAAPFHGVSFCLDEKHWNEVKLSLHYSAGYVQKTIEIKGLTSWIVDKKS